MGSDRQREAVRLTGKKNRTHGMTGTPTYGSWVEMKQRCLNPNDPFFHRYGGRGITICGRWLDSFENFLADMGERPKGQTLERVKPDGNYEPGNVKWGTHAEQARNRSNNVMLTFRGETMCIAAWAERIGLPRKTLEKRLNHHGFTVEQALTLPLRSRRPA